MSDTTEQPTARDFRVTADYDGQQELTCPIDGCTWTEEVDNTFGAHLGMTLDSAEQHLTTDHTER